MVALATGILITMVAPAVTIAGPLPAPVPTGFLTATATITAQPSGPGTYTADLALTNMAVNDVEVFALAWNSWAAHSVSAAGPLQTTGSVQRCNAPAADPCTLTATGSFSSASAYTSGTDNVTLPVAVWTRPVICGAVGVEPIMTARFSGNVWEIHVACVWYLGGFPKGDCVYTSAALLGDAVVGPLDRPVTVHLAGPVTSACHYW